MDAYMKEWADHLTGTHEVRQETVALLGSLEGHGALVRLHGVLHREPGKVRRIGGLRARRRGGGAMSLETSQPGPPWAPCDEFVRKPAHPSLSDWPLEEFTDIVVSVQVD